MRAIYNVSSKIYNSEKFMKGSYPVRVIRVLSGRLSQKVYPFFAIDLYKDENAADLVAKINPHCFIFDWTSPIQPLQLEAKRNNIPTFALPHGMNTFYNQDVEEALLKPGDKDPFNCDYVLCHGPHSEKHLIHGGTPVEKITKIGSMRFCREWMSHYSKRICTEEFKGPDTSNKLKVVVFLSKLKYRGCKSALMETLESLCSNPSLYVILKPHTRTMHLDFLTPLMKKYTIDIRENVSSVRLSEWCDVGMVWASSIGLQLLFDNKVFVYPTYMDSNTSCYEKYEAAWCVNSLDDLNITLQKLSEGNGGAPYTEVDVDNLFSKLVYADDLDKDVIQEYYDFIKETSLKHLPLSD
ncbi:MAG: hypothetical protein NE328_20175 [Lentisphaeraceae bacterium]|nr:hypothetical protein [Lentisphaeraceae bacterium]